MATLSLLEVFLVKFIVVNLFIMGIFYIIPKSDATVQTIVGYASIAFIVIVSKISSAIILLAVLFYLFAPKDSMFFSVFTEVVDIIVILFISVLLWLKLLFVPNNRLKAKNKQKRQDIDYDFFSQIEQEALGHDPDPEVLWQYSVLLGQLNKSQIKTHWKQSISTKEIETIAEKYFNQALRNQSLSAKVDFANQQISQSIENSEIIDLSAVEASLDQLISALGVKCKIKYPVINNKQVYNQQSRHWDLRDIVKKGRASFIDRYGLTEAIVNYPSLHNRCDVLQLHQEVIYTKQQKAVYMLLRYLINSPVPPFQHKWHSSLRHLVYLSVLAELLGRSDIMDLLNKQCLEQDKATFNQQRQSLIADYYQAFNDTNSALLV